jgi:fibronectin-binding autotransporter adhesin
MNSPVSSTLPLRSCLFPLLLCVTSMSLQHVKAQFTFATDNASDGAYSGGLANGNNGGSGFNAWNITYGNSTGTFVGNPSNDGMGTTGIGTTSWGAYASGSSSGWVNATRSLSTAMQVGDSFSFYWAMNWDSGGSGGSKGFDLKNSSGINIFTLVNTSTQTISYQNAGTGTVSGNYGTTPMLVTVNRTSSSEYDLTITRRDTSEGTFSLTISSALDLDRVNFFEGKQSLSNGNQNTYFNNLVNQNSGNYNSGGSRTESRALTGSGDLEVSNSTTLTLTNSGNTFTGSTTITSGTLNLGGGGANGFIGSTSGITNNGALVYDLTSTGTLGMSISGTGSLTKQASGALILSGSNSYTGATTINAGTLEVQNANALGTTAAGTTVSSGAVLKVYNASGISVTGESLSINGTGVGGVGGALLSTGGTNTWTGGITLAGNSRINTDTSGGAGSLTLSGTVGGGANVLFVGPNGAAITISGAISGSGASQDETITSLFKDESGALTLSGANTYTGDTRISAGNLIVASGGSLGSGSDVYIASSGTLTVNASTTVASFQEWGSGNGGVVAVGSGAVLTMNGDGLGNVYQNSISGAGGITVAGSGDTALNLYGSQTYTGATAVSAGKISTGVTLATSGVTVSGGTFETTAADILDNSATVVVSGGTYDLGGDDTVGSLTISSGSLAGSNTLTASTYALQGGTVGANLGAGTVTVTSGTTTLSGTLGAATVNVNSGNLTLGSANRLSDSAAITIGGGTLALGSNNDTVGGFTITSGSLGGTGTLTASTYALQGGTVGANLGAGTVTVSSGTTTLSGTSSSTTINITSGNLTTGSANRISDSAAVTISSGADLALGGSETVGSIAGAGDIALGANTLTAGGLNTSTTLSGVISGSGGLAKDGSGNLTLSGANTYTGTSVINAGTLSIGASDRIANSSALFVASGATFATGGFSETVDKLTGAGSITLGAGTLTTSYGSGSGSFSGVLSGSGGLTLAGAADYNAYFTLSGANTYTGDTTLTGATLILGADNTISSSSALVVSGGRLSASNRNQTFDSITMDDGAILRDGGTLAYNNGATLTGGSVTIRNSGGTLSSGGVTTLGNVTLTYNATTANFNAMVLGGNVVVNAGATTVFENGPAGGQGYVKLGDANRVFDVGAGGNLNMNWLVTSDTLALGSLTKNGSGTLTLNAGNAYAGGTTLNSGTLVIGNASGAGSGTLTQTDGTSIISIATTGTISNAMSLYNLSTTESVTLSGSITVNNATFDVADGDTLTISGGVSGSGGVTKNGTGTLVLEGTNTYTGNTEINAGTLQANSAGALGNSTASDIIVNGGSLLVTANSALNGHDITLAKSATGNASVAGLAFSGTYNGTAGSLTLSENSTIDLGTGSVVIHFASIANLTTYTLDIFNWSGDSVWSGNPGGGTDQFYIDQNLSSSQLSNINFYSGTETSSFISTGFQIIGGSFNQEIIAVPEPETYAVATLLLAWFGVMVLMRKKHPATTRYEPIC